MTVFVGPSIWRQMDVRTATAFFSSVTSNPTGERVIWAPLWNDALIGRSRSIMCTEFLKTDADVMVIIDDDIVWEPPDFWKIVEGARETRGVYGGAYVTRSKECHISSRAMPGTGPQVFKQGPVRRPIEYQYLATGFWAVHRDVMEAMIRGEFVDAFGIHTLPLVELGADRPFYPFFSPFIGREDDGRLHYLSEDWAFSNRARQLGFKVWVDLSIVLMHMGLYPFTVADLNPARKESDPGFPSTGIDLVDMVWVPELTGDPLIDNLPADVAEFTGDDIGDVRRMMAVADDELNRLWLTRSEDEGEWYERQDVGYHYLAGLANWHYAKKGGVPLAFAEKVAGKRLLDFGSGIGTWSLAAARAGAEVWAVEVNPVLREFTEWRARKYSFSVNVVQHIRQALKRAGFDAASAWHVFEHLPNPAHELAEIGMRLKVGGLLITDSGFGDASAAMHHVRRDWEEVLKRHGFEKEGEALYRLFGAAGAL